MIKHFPLFLFLLINIVESDNIQWNENVGTGCDFVNNDLSNARTSSEDCFQRCNQTISCTHFTWTTWNGGTCWMKKGIVYKGDAFSTMDSSIICGVLYDDSEIDSVENSPTSIITNILPNASGKLTTLPCFAHFLFVIFMCKLN
ncbi:unnamed protein product [Adineta ricciae]|uniref:Apple domain-containing protein n=1 Tax=Adineta ricciae TaxID=249248 RepID=A0A815MMQ9_ADIRI|nr:unnamed protein product [Adineta ricciae]CAF1422702.1 unnamed protein product [Adineta ricciae]